MIMLVFISLQILLAVLAGLFALLSMPNIFFARFPTCLRAAVMLAMLFRLCASARVAVSAGSAGLVPFVRRHSSGLVPLLCKRASFPDLFAQALGLLLGSC